VLFYPLFNQHVVINMLVHNKKQTPLEESVCWLISFSTHARFSILCNKSQNLKLIHLVKIRIRALSRSDT